MSNPVSEQDQWFEKEVQPHEPALRAYLHHRFPHGMDVDDLVQESYVRLLDAKKKGPIASTKAYLFAIARNAALTLLRRPQIFSEIPITNFAVQSVMAEGDNAAEIASTRQEVAILLDAVDRLPVRCREIYILHKLQGLSQKEVAARLGLSLQTIQVQVARGTAKCTKFLRHHGVIRS